ncbi:4 TM domain-containing transmembrane protein [Acrasis kona]|uniref:4 TM domain-containing transmembrane protein n=1 Tax=Acrasis kona TaxID=1008807 RepID=A0AAW2ZHW0_9EUKA
MVRDDLSRRQQHKIKAKKNNEIIQRHAIITLVTMAIYSIYRVYFNWESFTTWPIIYFSGLVSIYLLCFKWISAYGRPLSSGEVNSLEVLNKGGLTEYIFDILYISWFVSLTSIITSYVWYIYLVVPIFAFYKAYTGILRPFLNNRNMMAQLAQQQQEEPLVESKRSQKLRAREEKLQARYAK